jgi:hypothetical protein
MRRQVSRPSWPGLSRPSTSSFVAQAWMPATSAGMTNTGIGRVGSDPLIKSQLFDQLSYAEPSHG